MELKPEILDLQKKKKNQTKYSYDKTFLELKFLVMILYIS